MLWGIVFPQIRLLVVSQPSVKELLLSLSESLSIGELELFSALCWAIWSDRNGFIHGRPLLSPEASIEWIG